MNCSWEDKNLLAYFLRKQWAITIGFPEKHNRWTTKLNINKFMLGLHNPFVKICMCVFVWYKYVAYIIIICITDKTKEVYSRKQIHDP